MGWNTPSRHSPVVGMMSLFHWTGTLDTVYSVRKMLDVSDGEDRVFGGQDGGCIKEEAGCYEGFPVSIEGERENRVLC